MKNLVPCAALLLSFACASTAGQPEVQELPQVAAPVDEQPGRFTWPSPAEIAEATQPVLFVSPRTAAPAVREVTFADLAPTTGELAGKLRTTRLARLSFDGSTSLNDAVHFIGRSAGVNVHVTRAAEEWVTDEGHALVLERDRPISAANALNLITELVGDEITWRVWSGVVYVSTRDESPRVANLQVFDVSDLTGGIPSFVPRDFGNIPIRDDLEEEPGVSHRSAVLEEEMLLELIRNAIDPERWDRPGNSVTLVNGRLVVRTE